MGARQNIFVCINIVLLNMIGSPFMPASELRPEKIYQRVLPSVMTLEVENTAGEKFVGCAFLALKEGLAVTAWHVIHDAKKVTARFSDNQRYEVLGFVDKNEKRDLAILKLNVSGRPKVHLSSTQPLVGSKAYVIGSPKGFSFTFSDGLISQIQIVDGIQQYQFSCPISSGNSGGPILNSEGDVVGISSWTKTDGQNLNFGVPSIQVAQLNPNRTLTRWSDWSQSLSKKVAAATPGQKTVSADTVDQAGDFAALKDLLSGAVGEEVTVLITKGEVKKSFTFTIPGDLLK